MQVLFVNDHLKALRLYIHSVFVKIFLMGGTKTVKRLTYNFNAIFRGKKCLRKYCSMVVKMLVGFKVKSMWILFTIETFPLINCLTF